MNPRDLQGAAGGVEQTYPMSHNVLKPPFRGLGWRVRHSRSPAAGAGAAAGGAAEGGAAAEGAGADEAGI